MHICNINNSFFIKIDPSKEKRKSLLVGKFLRKNISDFALAMAIDNNLNYVVLWTVEEIKEFFT